MRIGTGRVNVLRLLTQGLAVACVLIPGITAAQGLTGALIGTVTDAQGGVISGAVVRISSPALMSGALTTKTDERGSCASRACRRDRTRSRSSRKDFARIATPTSASGQGPPSNERLSSR